MQTESYWDKLFGPGAELAKALLDGNEKRFNAAYQKLIEENDPRTAEFIRDQIIAVFQTLEKPTTFENQPLLFPIPTQREEENQPQLPL